MERERSNRSAHLAALAVLLFILAPASGDVTAPALLATAMTLAVFAFATSRRRGRAS